jgi:hypothetical protein
LGVWEEGFSVISVTITLLSYWIPGFYIHSYFYCYFWGVLAGMAVISNSQPRIRATVNRKTKAETPKERKERMEEKSRQKEVEKGKRLGRKLRQEGLIKPITKYFRRL